ncbi:hypothetical protein CsatA_024850 [Cannabis sativa]
MGLLWKSATMRKGYEGSWFKAKIIESLVDDNFWVEYKDLVTEDEVPQPLREKAERRHIRPEPPLAPPEYQFKFSEKVDAWYNDGWWEGEISKVLPFSSYNVYFKHTREEITFSYSHLRPHRDWIKGKWSIPPASHTIHTQPVTEIGCWRFWYPFPKSMVGGGSLEMDCANGIFGGWLAKLESGVWGQDGGKLGWR